MQSSSNGPTWPAGLIENDPAITLVAGSGGTIAGFAAGTFTAAPSVYDPGSPTCVVDDSSSSSPNSGSR